MQVVRIERGASKFDLAVVDQAATGAATEAESTMAAFSCAGSVGSFGSYGSACGTFGSVGSAGSFGCGTV